MARGGRRGGGSGGRGRGSGRGSRSSGDERYGRDAADEALGLHDDDEPQDEDSDADYEAEDVMAFDSGPEADEDEGGWGEEEEAPSKKKADKASAKSKDTKESKSKFGASAGWTGADFYGGDDAGDDSESASDEGLVLEEVRKLEEVRARRLAGADDPLAALLPQGEGDDDAAEKDAAPQAAAPAGSSGTARFESVFAAEAEHGSAGKRSLEALPESKRRGLLKREAPELPPLLEDFRTKLKELRELLPLLANGSLSQLPDTGARYVRSKATLLLSTLANLSFYVLLRAEGGSVRTHPVVSQLVWLRELHARIAPLDERLGKQLRKALRAAQRAPAPAAAPPKAPSGVDKSREEAAHEAPVEPEGRRRPTIRERVEQLREASAKALEVAAKAQKTKVPAASQRISATDLLRLPTSGKKAAKAAAAAAAADDLDEVDPVLGMRMPMATLGEQISEVQQLVRERGLKEKQASADTDVAPRKSTRRERVRLEESAPAAGFLDQGEAFAAMAANLQDDGEEDELVKRARKSALAKKERRMASQQEAERQRIASQDRPEEVLDGRRSTSKRILQNRGLVRQRKKQAGNARVANRTKYQKAVKRRKGAVQEMREGAADGATYAGEETGIRTHLKKSQRLA